MKLVVCDLDGTLLEKNEKKLKNSILKNIKTLKSKGVLFACASGRTFGELKRIFNSADIYYISSDGALACSNDETIFEKSFTKKDLEYFFSFENVVFHSKFISHIKLNSKIHIKNTINEYIGHTVSVSSFGEIDSPVYKITVLDSFGEAEKIYSKIYDGKTLSDFAPSGTNKGSAVKALCEKLGIKKEDLYVAGDNLNDIPMLSLTENSYCVKNSKYKTRKSAKHETLSGEAFLAHLVEIL